MKKIEINLNDMAQFRCGDEIRGTVSWNLESKPERIFVRLFWYTSGKGTMDVGIKDEFVIENPGFSNIQNFNFKAPSSPYSFSGRLISIIWAVEALTSDKKHTESVQLEISPTGREIVLGPNGD